MGQFKIGSRYYFTIIALAYRNEGKTGRIGYLPKINVTIQDGKIIYNDVKVIDGKRLKIMKNEEKLFKRFIENWSRCRGNIIDSGSGSWFDRP